MIRKNITIKSSHEEWIENNSINLSRFVQKYIDAQIKSDMNAEDNR